MGDYAYAGNTWISFLGPCDFCSVLLSLKDRDVKIANWHARLNVIALLIFAASFYLRTTNGSALVNGGYASAIGLSVFGVILISISGYLGGEMVFKHGVAVDQRPQARTKL